MELLSRVEVRKTAKSSYFYMIETFYSKNDFKVFLKVQTSSKGKQIWSSPKLICGHSSLRKKLMWFYAIDFSILIGEPRQRL